MLIVVENVYDKISYIGIGILKLTTDGIVTMRNFDGDRIILNRLESYYYP